eukprot:scaffold118011_cov75-Phaeocystis_antarctica.AAC.3
MLEAVIDVSGAGRWLSTHKFSHRYVDERQCRRAMQPVDERAHVDVLQEHTVGRGRALLQARHHARHLTTERHVHVGALTKHAALTLGHQW